MKKFLLLAMLTATPVFISSDAEAQSRNYIPQTKFSREIKIPKKIDNFVGNNENTINRALSSNKRSERRMSAAERRKRAREDQRPVDENAEDRTQSETRLSEERRNQRAWRQDNARNRNTSRNAVKGGSTAQDGLND